MMRKNITRTLVRSDIYAYCVKMEGTKPVVTELPLVTVWGKPSKKEAIKAVQDVHGKDVSITIGKIESSEETYMIKVEDFVAIATKVDKSEAENDQDE